MMMKTMILGLTICSLFYSSGGHSAYTTICKTQTGAITFCPGVPPQATIPPVPKPQATSPQVLSQPVPPTPTQATIPPVPPTQATIPPVPPTQATSPNWCRNGKPRNPTEDVICNTTTLWAWDVEYNNAYKLVLSKGGHPDGMANLKDRNKYVLPIELAVWYQSAITQLTQSTPSQQAVQGGGQAVQGGGAKMDWCGNKLNTAENILCNIAATSAPQLAALDKNLNDAYKAFKKQKKQKQKAWLEQRNAFILSSQGWDAQLLATTLYQMYQTRLAELRQ